jgi:hypothetical protein
MPVKKPLDTANKTPSHNTPVTPCNTCNIDCIKQANICIRQANKKVTYCKLCRDDSEVSLDEAKAITLDCIDFRLRDNITCQLGIKNYKNDYDEVIAAGSSLGYNGLTTYKGWNVFVDEQIQLSYDLHKIHQILIIDHEACGAYKLQYGDDITREEEYKYHVLNVNKCAKALWKKFNPKNGSVTKIPNLTIIGYIISIDGSTFTELCRIH